MCVCRVSVNVCMSLCECHVCECVCVRTLYAFPLVSPPSSPPWGPLPAMPEDPQSRGEIIMFNLLKSFY